MGETQQQFTGKGTWAFTDCELNEQPQDGDVAAKQPEWMLGCVTKWGCQDSETVPSSRHPIDYRILTPGYSLSRACIFKGDVDKVGYINRGRVDERLN